MVELKKMIESLTDCINLPNCTTCEYWKYMEIGEKCPFKMRLLELLQDMEARVIDFNEINNYEVLYLEVRDVKGESGLAPWVKTKKGKWFSPLECSEEIKEMRLVRKEEYNVIARCWTQRPTEEQRKAQKWK